MNKLEVSRLDDLAIKLFEINAIKFGEFKTKSGIKTPVYFDLRVIVSYPDLMEQVTSLLYDLIIEDVAFDHICGVPYTALPMATLLSVKLKKSMLMKRKEAKDYGTKKIIEGHYKPGQTCLIIEDVVTSGSSVLETTRDLQKEGLLVSKAFVILDREQGACGTLKKNLIEMKALFSMTSLIEILQKMNLVTKQTALEVQNYIRNTSAPVPDTSMQRLQLPYEKRADLASNTIAKKLFNIMVSKKSNLCLSVDLTSTKKILDLVHSVGQHVCLVKTHMDIIEDFNLDFVKSLKQLASSLNFVILEDRKYADIGNTVALQYSSGVYRVSEWADCITVHALPGAGVLKALKSCSNATNRGIFLLAEMSSEGNLITQEYTEAAVKMGSKYPELMTGFVCQNKATFQDPGLLQLTPGIRLEHSEDGIGQIYNSPEDIIKNGADIAVVGRGIILSKNPEIEAAIYKDRLWQCYLERIKS